SRRVQEAHRWSRSTRLWPRVPQRSRVTRWTMPSAMPSRSWWTAMEPGTAVIRSSTVLRRASRCSPETTTTRRGAVTSFIGEDPPINENDNHYRNARARHLGTGHTDGRRTPEPEPEPG